jgi:nicotinamidase-related amidase
VATVLITQCLQRDFVDPIGPHDPLPNLLHVGYSEATRLLGPEPAAGPLAQVIQWARGLPSDAIDLVHIRDWHDADDPAQREHLVRFGTHCIKNTVGARLVLEMDQGAEAAANECIVDSITLNDLEGTDLEEQLTPACTTRSPTRRWTLPPTTSLPTARTSVARRWSGSGTPTPPTQRGARRSRRRQTRQR